MSRGTLLSWDKTIAIVAENEELCRIIGSRSKRPEVLTDLKSAIADDRHYPRKIRNILSDP
jgi:hypothetical protein